MPEVEEKPKLKATFTEFDSGFCRAYFKTEFGSRLCIQEEMDNVFMVYACTSEGEPDYRLKEHRFEFLNFVAVSDYAKRFEKYINDLSKKGVSDEKDSPTK